MSTSPERGRAAALAAAGLTAALQLAAAARAHALDHLGAVALGWGGALALAWAGRRRAGPPPPAAARAAAWAGWALTVAALLRQEGAYHPLQRLLPLAAGLALAMAAEGPRGSLRHLRPLLLLATPLVCPLPAGLRAHVLGLRSAAAGAELALRAVGFPVERSGLVLAVPGATVQVEAACSALGLVGQLLALALLALCLFPAPWPRRALVVAWAVAVAAAVNCVRIAFLCIVASRAPRLFETFDGGGPGATAFPVLAVLLLLPGWWLLLRRAGAGRAAARAGPAQG